MYIEPVGSTSVELSMSRFLVSSCFGMIDSCGNGFLACPKGHHHIFRCRYTQKSLLHV